MLYIILYEARSKQKKTLIFPQLVCILLTVINLCFSKIDTINLINKKNNYTCIYKIHVYKNNIYIIICISWEHYRNIYILYKKNITIYLYYYIISSFIKKILQK